ncbi:2-phosphosulfolactate phosphatase [candidate division KSB1 bacterium]|nr:2-phosphosulfolactate phosphatase [candidate division KSB1 bacterium]
MFKEKKSIKIFEKPADTEFCSFKGSIAVVIDVLRATSTIINAIHNGCRGVVPVAEIERALLLRQQYFAQKPLLCGERYGKKIDGFDLGNSPAEYQNEVVRDKVLILTTTNGTPALTAAQEAKVIYVLSLLNLETTVNQVACLNEDINIICAGTNGQTSLEDNVCAGLFINELVKKSDKFLTDNKCSEIVTQANEYRDNLLTMLRTSRHGQYLEEIGFGPDLEFCSKLNFINACAVFENGMIINSFLVS